MTHGRTGTFLSSVAALSILTIVSHYHLCISQNTLILHHLRPVARLVPAPSHHQLKYRNHGTRVTVQELFGNMPVRVKQRALEMEGCSSREREWESMRRNIIGTLLAWHAPISLSVRGPDKEQKLHLRTSGQGDEVLANDSEPKKSGSFDPTLLRSILIQGGQIDPADWNTWVKTSAQTPFLIIRALFSLQPAPSRHVQFISLGIQHISHENGHNFLYDEVNRLFASSSFGAQEEPRILDGLEGHKKAADRRYKHDGFTNKQLRGNGKGVDKWPMFYIRIELLNERISQAPKHHALLEEGSAITSIVNVLRTMVSTFLGEHHLRPRAAKRHGKRNTLPIRDSARYGQKIHSGRSVFGDVSNSSQKGHIPSFTDLLSADGEPQREYRTMPSVHEFGGKVKLPSFAQSNTLQRQDDFNSWSRVKSGARKSISSLNDFKPSLSKPSRDTSLSDQFSKWKVSRDIPASDPTEEQMSEASPATKLPDKSTSMGEKVKTPLLITDNTNEDKDTTFMPIIDHEESISNPDGQFRNDGTLSWTNPITKDTFIINSRTGMVMPRPLTPLTLSSSSSSSSSSCPNTGTSHPFSQRRRSGASGRWRLDHSNIESLTKPKTGSWADRFLQTWENPVFHQSEESIPQVLIEGSNIETSDKIPSKHERFSRNYINKGFEESSLQCFTKLERESLENATVLAQVDKKYILLKICTALTSVKVKDEIRNNSQVLVLVDQHAADERIRIEALLMELCARPSLEISGVRSKLGFISAIHTTRLEKAIMFHITVQEHRLFQRYAALFARWGILFDLSQPRQESSLAESQDGCQVTIHTLPPGIAERCRVDVPQLAKLMRGEVWRRQEGINSRSMCVKDSQPPISEGFGIDNSLNELSNDSSWLDRIRDCPQGILDMLNSRSCRSAIMFNDILTLGQCETLIQKLSACHFPFQCAHGRPSMIPLLELDLSDTASYGFSSAWNVGRPNVSFREEEMDFREAWRTWRIPERSEMG